MTGAYLRVKRDGKFENIEIEHLTDDEREKLLSNDDRLMQWLHVVSNKLADADRLLASLAADGIIELV